MRALIIFGLLLAAPLTAAPQKELPVGPKINVLVSKSASSAFLEVRGGYKVIRKDTGSTLSSGHLGKRFVAHALQDGLRWGEEYPDVYQISVQPTTPETLIYVDGKQYKGSVSIYHVRGNHITVVNEVPIEDYLKSTLALAYDKPLTQEAMHALTILARTEAYARALHGKSTSRPWDITAKEAHYYGYGVTQQNNGVDEAVEKTRYMVMEANRAPAQNISLLREKAEELAKTGFDAKRILQTSFPNHKLGITIPAEEVAIK